MVKRKIKRSPREVIEEAGTPRYEHSWVKFSGEEPIEITKKSDHIISTMDQKKLRDEWKKRGKKKYAIIHTHPTNIDKIPKPEKYNLLLAKKLFSIPGGEDLLPFLRDDQEKYTVVTSREPETGKVRGHTIVKKTKSTPRYRGSPVKPSLPFYLNLGWANPIRKLMGMDPHPYLNWVDKDNTKSKKEMREKINEYNKRLKKAVRTESPEKFREAFDEVIKDFNLNYKFLPAKGYKLNSSGTAFVPKKNLERKIVGVNSILGISALTLGLFFLSSNLTGFTISNLTQKTSNIIGITLFIIGLIGSLYYFRRKR